MTELSYFWDGVTTGDASIAPYDSQEFLKYFKSVLQRFGTSGGVIHGYGQNLKVTGTASPVSVGTGAAVVDGTPYENTSALSVAISTPASNPRYDLIVLRKTYLPTQRVRVAVVTGTEAASPVSPTVTQDSTVWEIALARALIATNGVITITPYAYFAQSPLGGGASLAVQMTTNVILPGGILGANGLIDIERFESGSVTFHYGGSSMLIGGGLGIFQRFRMAGNGATNSQKVVGVNDYGSVSCQYTTWAIDSTADQLLRLDPISSCVMRYYPPTWRVP